MKIAFDAKRYYHNHTGLGNYSRTLVSGLQTFCRDEVECVLYNARSLERTFRLGQRAKVEGCDLFHGLSNELPLDVNRAGLPNLVTIHDVAWRTFPAMYHWIDRQLYDLKYGWAARNATRVICISESTKRDVMRFYDVPAERIDVLYQPVQDLFYHPLTAEAARHIIHAAESSHTLSRPLPAEGFVLCVGAINRRKNLLSVVQAMERIPAEQRPLLLVVGRGREYQREVEQYVEAHGMQDSVRIESGVQDNRLLQALYTVATLMVYPSFYEGMGLPVIEAELQGRPVITSTVSSLPETTGPEGMLVDPRSVDEIHHAISRLLDDSTLAAQLGQRGRDFALKNFDPETQSRRLAAIYKAILSV